MRLARTNSWSGSEPSVQELGGTATALLLVDDIGRVEAAQGATVDCFGVESQDLLRLSLSELLEATDALGRHELATALAEPTAGVILIRTAYRPRSLPERTVALQFAAVPSGRAASLRPVLVRQVHSGQPLRPEASPEEGTTAPAVIDRLVSRLAHELRTPLNAIVGFADLLLRSPNSGIALEQRQWVSHIADAGRYMTELTETLTDFAQLQTGSIRLATQSLAIGSVVSEAVNMIRPKAFERDIAIGFAVGDTSLKVAADRVRVEQVLLNLLSNAVKYNKQGGAIHVDVMPAGPAGVGVEVTDTGLGLDRKQLGSIFEPFNRLGRETSGTAGSGVGLCIAQRLTRLMGGSLSVRSDVDRGTTFRLALPVPS